MKRILLFLSAMMLAVFFVSAQGVWKFETAEDALPEPGTVYSVDGCDFTWYDTPSENGIMTDLEVVDVDGEQFAFALQSTNNPKPWQYPEFGAAAMYLFDCTKDGILTIVTAVNPRKNTYICVTDIVEDKSAGNYCYVLCGEEGVTDYLYPDEPTFKTAPFFVAADINAGEGVVFNGARAWDLWDLVEGDSNTMEPVDIAIGDDAASAITSWICDDMKIQAEAGKCYSYFCTGSKAAIFGFMFTESVGVNNVKSSATVVKTEYFNILGVKSEAPVKGVNIIKKTMSDGSVVTSKGVFFR
ncbi:MAG: hypothetical protein JW798_06780 [Prolixibacteraceae bacterium]|nr:hypothetical protein [Prolixibacteraceae bacterium]